MTVQSDANHQASAMHPLAFLLGSLPRHPKTNAKALFLRLGWLLQIFDTWVAKKEKCAYGLPWLV
jgi:hypothetical protein